MSVLFWNIRHAPRKIRFQKYFLWEVCGMAHNMSIWDPLKASTKKAIGNFTQLRREHFNPMQYLHSITHRHLCPCLFAIPGKISVTFVEVHLKHLSLFLSEGLLARILSQLEKTTYRHFFGQESMSYPGIEVPRQAHCRWRKRATPAPSDISS